MSDAENGADNPSDNSAMSLQRAEPKEGEGNVRPVSLVQQIFSDPEALNLLRQAFIVLQTKMEPTERSRLQALLRN